MRHLSILAVMGALALGCASTGDCCGSCGGQDVALAPAHKDIVDTAASAGQFNTLVTAVKAADLVETLKGEGPFTVFAPTDEAFAALPEGTLDSLLQDKEKLTAVLTYHVVAGRVMAEDMVQMASVRTLQGQDLPVADANVVAADIEASNGVIQVIDSVLIPR